ncbi:hypothetical protein [Polymorphospora sp. NPDC050346]|uniref:hypothetical protein n=1 Tax=Polymorphospora sp. NPDC050346 TaxID=3155780 RepID=UPI0033FF30E4
MTVPAVPLPTGAPGATAADVAAGIAGWLGSPALSDLVTAFGGRPPTADLGTILAWLDDFSAAHWDFRAGRERPEAREPALPAETAGRVLASARALGLVTPRPPARSGYAHLVVLGGLAHACVSRVRRAARLLRPAVGSATAGAGITAATVAVLGSFRPLTADETASLAAAGVTGCRSEVDALDATVRREFDVDVPVATHGENSDDPHRSWSERIYRPAGGPQVRVLAAPSGDPAVRRAHTADTQRFWASRIRLSPGDPVLLVTAPIYVPFQHCDALRTLGLPYGCGIETVGHPPSDLDDRMPVPVLTPGRYLQEIRSAVRSMRALHATLS